MFQLRNLQFGDVINSYKKHLPFYDIPGQLIRWHQKKKWDGVNYKSTHSVLYLEGGIFFEVTAPRARFGNINEFTDKSCYTVCRYRDANISSISDREKDYFREACWDYDNTKYDYFQLVDIGIKGILDWVPEYLPIFDLGRRRKVCSVFVVIAYLNWYESVRSERKLRRPLGEQHAEVAAPADFENHPTFKRLGELVI